MVFKRARSKIKDMLKVKNAWTGGAEGKDFFKDLKKVHKESDLELKSRSQFLQQRKVAIKKKGAKQNVVNETDADRI